MEFKDSKSINKVMVVAKNYYPEQIIGSHRSGKLVKYLSQDNFTFNVLTVKSKFFQGPEELQRLDDIPANTTVVRTGVLSLSKLAGYLRGFKKKNNIIKSESIKPDFVPKYGLKNIFEVPDDAGWIPYALIKGFKYASKVDIIWSTSPSTAAHVVALVLSIFFRKIFVADFRDPWRIEKVCPYPTRFHRIVDHFWFNIVCKKANKIIIVSERMVDYFDEKYKDKIEVVCNGYDPEDLYDIQNTHNIEYDGFKIGYFGSLYQGREDCFADFLKCITKYKEKSCNDVMVFVRSHNEDIFVNISKANEVEEIVNSGKAVPYKEALAMMKEMDALLIVGSEYHDYALPGKLFEYIGVGRPIIALTPPGALEDFINKYGVGVSDSSPDKLVKKIECLRLNIAEFEKNIKKVSESFTRQKMAAKMGIVFDSLINRT